MTRPIETKKSIHNGIVCSASCEINLLNVEQRIVKALFPYSAIPAAIELFETGEHRNLAIELDDIYCKLCDSEIEIRVFNEKHKNITPTQDYFVFYNTFDILAFITAVSIKIFCLIQTIKTFKYTSDDMLHFCRESCVILGILNIHKITTPISLEDRPHWSFMSHSYH